MAILQTVGQSCTYALKAEPEVQMSCKTGTFGRAGKVVLYSRPCMLIEMQADRKQNTPFEAGLPTF